jgi:tubulin-specific chaperone D
MDPAIIAEEAFDFLFHSLGDSDSPVRFAASKALSLVTQKLNPNLIYSFVDGILDLLNQDVLWNGSSPDLAAVPALRWHGLILTLSHLLYRRAPSTLQLPEVLKALTLALQFNQRLPIGASVGANVRDAANFGIWSLARRYTTAELLAVDTKSITNYQDSSTSGINVLQYLATQLLVTACLDPAGNIRRGSSAALQELIGRHPDVVSKGIALVQIVDYHAVGLRERALNDVAFQAAVLDNQYWEALYSELLEWRGIGAVDASSRAAAAQSIGRYTLLPRFHSFRTDSGHSEIPPRLCLGEDR